MRSSGKLSRQKLPPYCVIGCHRKMGFKVDRATPSTFHDLLHPLQAGGVRQRSTVDAGVFLTHNITSKRDQGEFTSTLAVDVVQFFPSIINHDALLWYNRRKHRYFFPRYLAHVDPTIFLSYLADLQLLAIQRKWHRFASLYNITHKWKLLLYLAVLLIKSPRQHPSTWMNDVAIFWSILC